MTAAKVKGISPAGCAGIDPLESLSQTGRRIHRHCRLRAGHQGPCKWSSLMEELLHQRPAPNQPDPPIETPRRNVAEGRLF